MKAPYSILRQDGTCRRCQSAVGIPTHNRSALVNVPEYSSQTSPLRQISGVWVRRLPLLLSLALLTFVRGLDRCHAQTYLAEGELDVLTKRSQDDSGKHVRHSFSLQVNDADYTLRIRPVEAPNTYYEYALIDGVMHILHHVHGSVVHISGRNLPTNPAAMFPARIENRDIPPVDGSRAQFAWFALASHIYFSKLTNNYCAPIWEPEDPNTRRHPFPMLVVKEMLQAPPGLPANVAFINEGYYKTYNPLTRQTDVFALAAPYDAGYTNAVYTVVASTNTGLLTLPTEFRFTVFSSPIAAGVPPFERIVVRAAAYVKEGATTNHITPPQFLGMASVADYRFRRERSTGNKTSLFNYAVHTVTNGAWPQHDQLSKLGKRAPLSTRPPSGAAQSPSTMGGRLILVAMGIAALLALFAAFRAIRAQKHNNQTHT